MKISVLIGLALCCFSCSHQPKTNPISGTWKMIYAETIENDSIQIKDLENTTFIKIINESHFAYFNQNQDHTNFYSGAGTYVLKDQDYTETLTYTTINYLKDQLFSFKVQIKEDTLIQTGVEHIEAAGINRQITEKYIRIH